MSTTPQSTRQRQERFRCGLCGLRLTGRVYTRKILGKNHLFCCKGCADHYEAKVTGGAHPTESA